MFTSECFISDNVKQFKINKLIPNYYIDENDQLFLLLYRDDPSNYHGAILVDGIYLIFEI